ncbi:hypothetical protein CBOM_07446 [Ceraceosorus bombacis]|uniref:Uncharacterized protein n=1 Tax=Ceraceosorus bombacis TaxID=401625 RepID=A0A0P1BCU9_9BASI|nr:hypothetical protein CBOM_07446 [Ceraceosorus bombacis]
MPIPLAPSPSRYTLQFSSIYCCSAIAQGLSIPSHRYPVNAWNRKVSMTAVHSAHKLAIADTCRHFEGSRQEIATNID